MSVTKRQEKIILHRTGPDHFWYTVAREFARDDAERWKHLAMLVLSEYAFWKQSWIGVAFGHDQGHVSRCLDKVNRDLATHFAADQRANLEGILLPHSGPDRFWHTVAQEFAGEDAARWKHLAMLVLREYAGWPLTWIGVAFDHHQGHVTRCLQQVKRDFPNHFDEERKVELQSTLRASIAPSEESEAID